MRSSDLCPGQWVKPAPLLSHWGCRVDHDSRRFVAHDGGRCGRHHCDDLGAQLVGSDTNPLFAMPFYWHMVLGGWAFGAVFMATDPVSSAYTERGKLYYGLGIGIMVVLVRVVNPAYPEGMMLAILFMNLFAPLFDYFAIQGNIKRRAARYAT